MKDEKKMGNREDDTSNLEVYRMIAENTSDLITIMSLKGIFVYASPSHKKLGYESGELVGKSAFDIIHPDDKIKVLPLLKQYVKMITGGISKEKAKTIQERIECRFPDKKGNWRNVEINANLIESSTGKGYEILLISRDVTDKRQTENALIESEQQYRMLVEGFNQPIIKVREDGEILFVNESASKIYGAKTENIIGKKMWDLFPKEIADRQIESVREAIKREERMIFENETEIGGRKLFLESVVQPVRNNSGKFDSVLVISIDVSDRKASEKALKESESSFRALFDNMNDGMLVVDAEGKRFTDCNYKLQKMTGYSRDEFIKMGIKDLHPKKDLPFILEQFEKQKKGILQTATDIPVKRKDGSIFYADITASFMEAFGQSSVVGNFRDMTDRRTIERQLSVFKAMADASGQGFGMAELDGTITYANGKLVSMLGEDFEEKVLGNKFFKYYPEEYRGMLKNEVLPTVMNEGQWIGELELVSKSGVVTPTIENLFLIKDAEGNPIYIADIMTDITERMKMEEDLRTSEAIYRTIFSNTGTVTAIIEENMTVQMVNSEFAKFFGYSKEEIEGKMNILEFVCKEEEEKVQNYHRLRRIDPEAAPRNYELRAIHKNKSVSDTFMTVAVIPETNRSVVSILDVTELKRNEFELQRQKDLLANTNKALEHKLAELQAAIGHIKKLEGLVPICSNCKKMMMEGHNPKDKDAWVSLEKFISERTNASFTHGLCPGCIKKMYGDMHRKNEK